MLPPGDYNVDKAEDVMLKESGQVGNACVAPSVERLREAAPSVVASAVLERKPESASPSRLGPAFDRKAYQKKYMRAYMKDYRRRVALAKNSATQSVEGTSTS